MSKLNIKMRLKEDAKFRNVFIGITFACVLIIAVAVIIPISIHNKNSKKTGVEISSTEITDEIESTAETTTLPDGIETTITEDNGTTTIVGITDANGNFVPTTVTQTTVNETVNTTTPKQNNTTTKKPSGNTTKATTKATTVAPAPAKFEWTQADVDEVVAEAKAYARNKGFTINSSKTDVDTSWGNPVGTDWCSSKEKATQNLHYQIDEWYNGVLSDFGEFVEGSSINIYVKNCGSYWKIYVVC